MIYEDGYKEVLRNKWNSLRDAEKKAVTFANEIAGMVWRSIILSVHASPWLDVWTAHESPNNNFTIAKGLQCLFKIKRVRRAL